MIKHFRLSGQARDQLIRLKSKTGITQWNVLCRWALAVSLSEPTSPTPVEIPADSNVEMTWQVFGGEHSELYWALLKARCAKDGVKLDEASISQQFRLQFFPSSMLRKEPGSLKTNGSLLCAFFYTRMPSQRWTGHRNFALRSSKKHSRH